jgi:TPR repeat protein
VRCFLFLVLLVLAYATVACSNSFEEAKSAYDRGDYKEAVRLFNLLAEKGNAKAQMWLGNMYIGGQGVPQDYQEALRWYRKAAEQGDAQALFNLGTMYENGEGIPQDYEEALRWYRKAAEQDNKDALLFLGFMYERGRGVAEDLVHAHMWYNIEAAASSGDDVMDAKRRRDDVASRMTSAQIEKAQEMARRCRQSKFKECD